MSLAQPTTAHYRAFSVDDPRRWDGFVAAPTSRGHFMQSAAWARLRERGGWTVERWAVADGDAMLAGAQVLFRATPLGAVAYVPRGPVVAADGMAVEDSTLRAATMLLEALHAACRRRGAIFLKLETGSLALDLRRLGFRPSRQAYQPKATIVVDITPDLATIAARQKSKTRYNIGLAQRRGVTVRVGDVADVPAFYRLLVATAQRDGFIVRAQDYYEALLECFGDDVRLFLAEHGGELLAGIVVCACGPEATYLYGASGNSHRNLMPNNLLQWAAMQWAKARGCVRYDLWGIPEAAVDDADADDAPGADPGKALWGVHRFKAGFGGAPLRHRGAYDYVYSPLRYWLWERLIPLYLRLRGADPSG